MTALRRHNNCVFNAFIRDLTEKIAAEEQARQASEMEAIAADRRDRARFQQHPHRDYQDHREFLPRRSPTSRRYSDRQADR